MKTFDRAEFIQDIKKLLALMASVPMDGISLDDRLREDIGLDSLQSMELLSRISEKWEVDVEMEDIITVKTVGDVVDFMNRLAAAA